MLASSTTHCLKIVHSNLLVVDFYISNIFTTINFTTYNTSYGSGIYIFTPDKKTVVQIRNRTFLQNEVTAIDRSSGEKFGGNSIYATVKKLPLKVHLL